MAPTLDLDAVARIVRGGGVVVYPSDTVYGLGGDARRPDVAARCRSAKGRGAVPMLVLADDWDRVLAWVEPDEHAVVREVGSVAGVTVLAAASPAAPRHLVGREGWLGVRLTSGPARTLIARSGAPLLSTSANPSGSPTPVSVAELDPALRARVDAVLNGGILDGAPSTIVRPQGESLVVLRQGAVAARTLSEITGCEVRAAG